MVLPLFHSEFAASPVSGELIRLSGSEGKHAATVRRMRAGEGIQLSNGNGLRVVGTVDAVLGNELAIRVAEVAEEALPNPRLQLIQALAKGDRDELAIQAATELGVASVIPWQADRSISRWDGPKVKKGVERWQVIVNEAAKQALRSLFPTVSVPVTTRQLAAAVKDYSLLLVLDPTADQPMTSVQLPDAGLVGIAVGPEGGISDEELGVLSAAGAVRVRLGAEILRTSTAGVAAVSVLQARLGRW